MKFLCVPCDTPMQLLEAKPPDGGSIALVYSCPDCGYEMAMLTNPMETQVVGSLGVKIGASAGSAERAAESGASKCPFTGMVQEMTGAAATSERTGFPWTETAKQRLDTIPDFVRPMAKTGIEKYARDKGYPQIDDAVLDEARQFFGM